ncbi:unnamed protein product, partial [Prunus brigantina]
IHSPHIQTQRDTFIVYGRERGVRAAARRPWPLSSHGVEPSSLAWLLHLV